MWIEGWCGDMGASSPESSSNKFNFPGTVPSLNGNKWTFYVEGALSSGKVKDQERFSIKYVTCKMGMSFEVR